MDDLRKISLEELGEAGFHWEMHLPSFPETLLAVEPPIKSLLQGGHVATPLRRKISTCTPEPFCNY